MEQYLVCVDGGGSKTEFCLADLEGNLIKSYFKGSTNHNQIGLEAMTRNLREGFYELLEDQKISMEDIGYFLFGIGGLDSSDDYELILEELLSLDIPKEKIYLCNDGLLSFYAGGTRPGLVVISGTGSIVFGIDREGEVIRSGGWGHPFSSLGSGFYLGNQLLKRTLLYCDGNYRYSPLFEEVRALLKAEDFQELPYKVSKLGSVAAIASLSKIVTEEAEKDKTLAMELLHESSEYLSDDVRGVYGKLNFEKEASIDIVFSGGVLNNPLYSSLLKEKISKKIGQDNIVFKRIKTSPAKDGINFARALYKERVKKL